MHTHTAWFLFNRLISTTVWEIQLTYFHRLPEWKVLSGSALQWRYNGRDSVSNHQPHDCLLNHLSRRRSKKTPKLRVTGLCAGNSPGTGEFPSQMSSNTENVSIWWRHHEYGVGNWKGSNPSQYIWLLLGIRSSGVKCHSLPNLSVSKRYIFFILKLPSLLGCWIRGPSVRIFD